MGLEKDRLHAERRRGIEARAASLRAIREYFFSQEFLEIEPCVRVPSPGLEVHIEAIRSGERYLITSPEYQMKRLLVGGLPRIYAISRCFRAEEEGIQHTSEFSMLEWYRAQPDLDAVARDTEALVAAVCTAVGGEAIASVPGQRISVAPPWTRVTVAELFARFAGFPLRGDETLEEFQAGAAEVGVDVSSCQYWDDVFYQVFLDRIEPELSKMGAVFVTEWPAPLAALARPLPGRPVVERFEAYVGGIELANAFGELTDAAVQRQRFENEQADRGRRGLEVYPIDERFLAGLSEGMPEAAGIALGVDRLVMLAAGIADIRDVQAFHPDEL